MRSTRLPRFQGEFGRLSNCPLKQQWTEISAGIQHRSVLAGILASSATLLFWKTKRLGLPSRLCPQCQVPSFSIHGLTGACSQGWETPANPEAQARPGRLTGCWRVVGNGGGGSLPTPCTGTTWLGARRWKSFHMSYVFVVLQFLELQIASPMKRYECMMQAGWKLWPGHMGFEDQSIHLGPVRPVEI